MRHRHDDRGTAKLSNHPISGIIASVGLSCQWQVIVAQPGNLLVTVLATVTAAGTRLPEQPPVLPAAWPSG